MYSKLSEKLKEYRKNTETDFMLSAKRTKINQAFSEEMGGKYKTVKRPHGLILDRKKMFSLMVTLNVFSVKLNVSNQLVFFTVTCLS
jgi:hypothetical protein